MTENKFPHINTNGRTPCVHTTPVPLADIVDTLFEQTEIVYKLPGKLQLNFGDMLAVQEFLMLLAEYGANDKDKLCINAVSHVIMKDGRLVVVSNKPYHNPQGLDVLVGVPQLRDDLGLPPLPLVMVDMITILETWQETLLEGSDWSYKHRRNYQPLPYHDIVKEVIGYLTLLVEALGKGERTQDVPLSSFKHLSMNGRTVGVHSISISLPMILNDLFRYRLINYELTKRLELDDEQLDQVREMLQLFMSKNYNTAHLHRVYGCRTLLRPSDGKPVSIVTLLETLGEVIDGVAVVEWEDNPLHNGVVDSMIKYLQTLVTEER